MAKSFRRSSLQVIIDMQKELERLEKLKAEAEKQLAAAGNPISLLLIFKIKLIGDMIATLVRAFRRLHRKKNREGMVTATNKRIKTKVLVSQLNNVAHGTTTTGVDAWTVERDITVIGGEVVISNAQNAATLAEIGGYAHDGALSRAATVGADSEFVRVTETSNWLAATLNNPSSAAREVIMFPEGFGIDMDDGEIVNLLHQVYSLQAADDTPDFTAVGIVYYVDR